MKDGGGVGKKKGVCVCRGGGAIETIAKKSPNDADSFYDIAMTRKTEEKINIKGERNLILKVKTQLRV